MTKRSLPLALKAVTLLALLLRAPGAFAQVTLDKQLLINPGAEDGPSAPKGTTVSSIPGWETVIGNFTVLDYAPGVDLPDTQGRRIGGGGHVFFGGTKDAIASAHQFIDVTPLASEIDQGGVTAVLSAFLTAFGSEDDNGVIVGRFYNAAGQTFGPTLNLGPQPGNSSRFVYWRTQATVPVGARKIEVQMIGYRRLGNDTDTYFDNLALFLTRSLPYAPGTVTPQTRQAKSANLITNPGAESGTVAANGYDRVPIPGWQTTGPFTVVKYAGPHAPSAVQGGLTNGENNAFSGGLADQVDTPSTASQVVDLSPYAADIDAGKLNLRFTLNLTGAGVDDGTAGGEVGIPHATVEELDAGGATIASVTTDSPFGLGDYFTQRRREAPLLKGVRKARVTLFAERGRLSEFDAAFFDNVSLSLVDAYKLPDPISNYGSTPPFDYGTNLLTDPGAESADPRFDDYNSVIPIPGWDSTGNFTAIDYYQPDFILAPEGERIGGGRAFFSGGANADLSTAAQTVDVGYRSFDIDEGRVTVHMEGQMGGWGGQGDYGYGVATFLDYATQPIGTLILGPSSSRSSYGGSMDFYTRDGDVPPGTRQIQFSLVSERLDSAYNDGYFDNLWMSLDRKAAPVLLMGDANGDGSVAVDDAVLLLRYCLHLSPMDAAAIQRADMNHDGSATITDAPQMLRRLVGLPWEG